MPCFARRAFGNARRALEMLAALEKCPPRFGNVRHALEILAALLEMLTALWKCSALLPNERVI